MKIKRLSSFMAVFTVSLFGAVFITTAQAEAKTCTWTGGSTGATDDAANWDDDVTGCGTGGTPVGGDDIVFPAPASADLVITNKLVFANTVTISGGTDNEHKVILRSTADLLVGNMDIGSGQTLDLDSDEAGTVYKITIDGASTTWILGDKNSELLVKGDLDLTAKALLVVGAGTVTSTTPSEDIPTVKFEKSIAGANSSALTITRVSSEFFGLSPAWDSNEIYVNDGRVILHNADGQVLGTVNNATFNKSQFVFFQPTNIGLLSALFTNGNLFGNTENDVWHAAITTGLVSVGSEPATFPNIFAYTTDINVHLLSGNLKITGSMTDPYKINVLSGSDYYLEIASSSNTSGMPNGTYGPPKETITVASGDNSTSGMTVHLDQTLVVNGERGSIIVNKGGVLKGTGKVGEITVESGGKVSPGTSPGCLAAGNTTFVSGSTFEVEIAGTTVCSEYDQLRVTGTVNLGNSTLNTLFLNGFKPVTGASFVIIDNDSNDAITGTFASLAEGATLTVDGVVFKISYVGGTDGNDVVLTVQSVPGTPNTGLGLLMANPGLTLLLTLASSAGLFFTARKYGYVSAISSK